MNYSETVSGALEVGKKADLIVLSNNIVNIFILFLLFYGSFYVFLTLKPMDQELISDTVVALTMANGAVVYNTLNK